MGRTELARIEQHSNCFAITSLHIFISIIYAERLAA
jgi:hypothetical protein